MKRNVWQSLARIQFHRFATGQEIVRGKKSSSQGKVGEIYFQSEKIAIFEKMSGKIEIIYSG